MEKAILHIVPLSKGKTSEKSLEGEKSWNEWVKYIEVKTISSRIKYLGQLSLANQLILSKNGTGLSVHQGNED